MEMACSTCVTKAGLCLPLVSGSIAAPSSGKQNLRHKSGLLKSSAISRSDPTCTRIRSGYGSPAGIIGGLLRHGVQCQAGSVDVSNEEKDKPSASSENEGEAIELDPRRGLEERFAVLYSGIHECSSCGYNYDQAVGDKAYPIPPGMGFRDLPEDWLCPTCGAAKSYFKSKSVEVAGFAQNQNYGLGGNSLTSGQKSLLIYGTLVFFFALFLSGYFLQ